ncbi:transglutaminase domain-containing protein [Ferruginibacter yonginensis]|uniref:Transglutaminase domain-containing protein n=1 Tax=Ferruginibacter yonginensis TaxID=1310416 RepID=A0ABV8QXJ9_9BACT
MSKLFCTIAILLGCSSAFAQHEKYKKVDETIEKIGALNNINVAVIADTITEPFNDNEQKARAIFYWISHHIAIDPKATKQNDTKNNLPENVIALRRATPLGFSLLFQEMCSTAKIRCLSVDGYVKHFATDINEVPDEINFSWNVVQLGQSPDTWFLVDACSASGYLDKKLTLFTKQFTSEYFFADRKLFNQAYYPDNDAWQLGGGVKSLKEYYSMPVINSKAFELDMALNKNTPITGFIKTKIGVPVTFNFSINPNKKIETIALIMGDDKKLPKPEAMNFENTGGTVTFSYKFKKEETFPVKIMIDGREALQYMVEVAE